MALPAFLAASGLVIAFRARLDFYEYTLLRLHVWAGFVFSIVLLVLFVPRLGRALGSRTVGIGYPLLVVLFAALPLTQYVFFQIDYALAALGIALFLALRFRPPGPRVRRAGASVALWLLALPVLVGGWHLALIDTLRSDFYPLFHRYGALAATSAFAFLLPRPSGRTMTACRVSAALGAGAAALAFAFALLWGDRLADAFAAHELPPTPAAVTVDLAQAAAGRDHLPRALVVPSSTCAAPQCHESIHAQWDVSPHHLAGRTEPYRKLLRVLAEEKGPEAVLLCSRCHTPLLALAGLPDNPDDRSQDGLRNEGVSCQYCHIVDQVRTPPANGLVTVEFESEYFSRYPLDDPAVNKYRHWLLRKSLRHHRAMYRRDVHQRSEYCAACHRVEMPIVLPSGKPLILGDTHSTWTSSAAAQEGIDCNACHLPLTVTPLPMTEGRHHVDQYHARPDHRFVGTCQSLALLVPEEAERLAAYDGVVVQRLLGEIEIPTLEYFYLWFVRSPKLPAFLKYLKGATPIRMEIALPLSVEPGQGFRFAVTSHNNTYAHVLPSGPLDLNELWLEVRLTDGSGQVLLDTPGLGSDGHLLPGARSLGVEIFDARGEPILNHRFWAIAEVRNKRVLEPGNPRTDEFETILPPDVTFPLRVEARWNYRRFTQQMADFVYGKGKVSFPVTTIAEASATMAGHP